MYFAYWLLGGMGLLDYHPPARSPGTHLLRQPAEGGKIKQLVIGYVLIDTFDFGAKIAEALNCFGFVAQNLWGKRAFALYSIAYFRNDREDKIAGSTIKI